MASAVFKFGQDGLIRWDGSSYFEYYENGELADAFVATELPRSTDQAKLLAEMWYNNNHDVAVSVEPKANIELGGKTDLASVVKDLRGPHPWIPGAVFNRHPDLAAALADFIEDYIEVKHEEARYE